MAWGSHSVLAWQATSTPKVLGAEYGVGQRAGERERERERERAVAILAQAGTHPRFEPSMQKSGSSELNLPLRELRPAGARSRTGFPSRSAMGLASAPLKRGSES